MAPEYKKICIVGSGLVGAFLAILLAEAGYEVDVYEKRKDPRKDTKTRGRTIALSLSDRGWRALKMVGLDEIIRANVNPAYGRMVHQEDGAMYPQDYGDGSQAIYTANRNYLNVTLLEKAASTGRVGLFFEHACEEVNEKRGEIIFTDSLKNIKIKKKYDHIIGVDGIFSAVRRNLSAKAVWKFESSTLEFGYKELCIPPDANGEHALMNHRVHAWPRKNSVLMAFPTEGGYFAASLFLPLTGHDSLASLTTPAALISFFEREYKDALPFMPNLEAEFFRNPSSTITQVMGGPWNYKDKVLLMGDACHAMTPFYGMGMNVGLEDCVYFIKLLTESNYNFGKTFRSLSKIRKPDTDAMTNLSYKNFQSLSESPDPSYHKKWLLERRIWKLCPDQWIPIYVLIAFSETPLQKVPAIKEKQDYILHEIMTMHPDVITMSDQQLKAVLYKLFNFSIRRTQKTMQI